MTVSPTYDQASELTPAIGSPVVRAAPIYLQIAARLRDAIAAGRIIPGQSLTERELADATGASRTSVREAVRQLQSEGLVTVQHGRGIEVVRLTAAQAADVYQVRSSLEATAAALFTLSATDEQVAELADRLQGVIATKDDHARLVEAKDAFYDCLLSGADNPTLKGMLDGLRLRIALLRVQSLAQNDRVTESIVELTSLVDAITRRDPLEASNLASAHVAAAARAALGDQISLFRHGAELSE